MGAPDSVALLLFFLFWYVGNAFYNQYNTMVLFTKPASCAWILGTRELPPRHRTSTFCRLRMSSDATVLERVGYVYLTGCVILCVLFMLAPNILLTWHDYKKQTRGLREVKLPSIVVVLSSEAELAEAVEGVTAAWAGSEAHAAKPEMLHQWICGAGKDSSTRRALLRWMVRFHFAYAFACTSGTVCFGVRDNDGTLAAAALVVPYLDGLPEQRSQTNLLEPRGPFFGGFRDLIRYIRALLSVGSLPHKAVAKRFNAARKVARKAHRQACRSARPHLHVGPLAVKPAAQGNKHASSLIAHIYACAFELSVGVYLECSSERAKAIFSRYGYRLLGDKPVSVADPASPDNVFRELWPMEHDVWRLATSSSTKKGGETLARPLSESGWVRGIGPSKHFIT